MLSHYANKTTEVQGGARSHTIYEWPFCGSNSNSFHLKGKKEKLFRYSLELLELLPVATLPRLFIYLSM